jgi:hypothetical protein
MIIFAIINILTEHIIATMIIFAITNILYIVGKKSQNVIRLIDYYYSSLG